MNNRLLALAIGLGVVSAANNVNAGDWFVSALVGIPDTFLDGPTWLPYYNASLGRLQNNTIGYKEILLPITFEDPATNPPWTWWAQIAVGGATASAPVSCRLCFVPDLGYAACSGWGSIYTSFDYIEMTVSNAYKAGFVDCSVPPNGWVGNIRWHPQP